MPRMNIYHDRNSPAAARVTLSRMKNVVGHVPSLAGVLAGAPGVLDACTNFLQHFMAGSLDKQECLLVILVASREFDNEYCYELAADTALKGKFPAHLLKAVEKRRTLRKKSYRALAAFVEAVIREGGEIRDEELDALRKVGYSEQQVLEIITGISVAWIWSNVSGVAGLAAGMDST